MFYNASLYPFGETKNGTKKDTSSKRCLFGFKRACYHVLYQIRLPLEGEQLIARTQGPDVVLIVLPAVTVVV